MVASAFPLAEVAFKAAEERRAAEANAKTPGEGDLPDVGDLPFPVWAEGPSPPSSSGDGLAGLAGPSSLPDASGASQRRASASGSVLVSQVLGAAAMMGYDDVEVPELPSAKLASKDPLRAAILAWIAATGAVVPPDELERELSRADAIPIETQRDVALLVLSAAEATLLQRAALAKLTPDEIEWVYTHPDVGEQLAQGIDTPETRYMAILAGKVDMRQSVAASALLLEAVEATRGSLSKPAAAQTVKSLAAGDLDPTTSAVLQLLAGAQGATSDKDKVLLAARLVALTSGFELPAPRAPPGFAEALDALLAQTEQAPDAAAVADVKERAALLPADLQAALARLILAQADAVKASNPAYVTPSSQAEALASMLVATAEALPVLEKYAMYWRAAPDALRVTEWDREARVGWVAHHAALFLTARGDLASLASAAPLLAGHKMPTASVPERSFTEAFLAFAAEAGFPVNATMLAEARAAEASLDPAVRDAAALLLSGSAESARLQRLAFAALSPEEERFLRHGTAGLDALYASPSPSDEDLDRLARATQLAARVDAAKLGESALVVAIASSEALDIVQGRDAFATQSVVTHVATGLRGFFARFLPVQPAQAQGQLCNPGLIVQSCRQADDTLLRIRYPVEFFNGRTPAEDRAVTMMASATGGRFTYTCNARECVMYMPGGAPVSVFAGNPGYANQDILVITGTEGRTYTPALEDRMVCTAVPDANANPTPYRPSTNCRFDRVPRYGSANIHLDLGGDDVWEMPVAVVAVNATVPVAIHIDAGGADRYNDPSPLYDALSPQLTDLGVSAGHPTQASALYGGVALLVDAAGVDTYDAPSRSQGFSRLGFALLADLGADSDLYRATTWSQGASSETFTLGAAILYDRAGSDSYTAASGQGFGLGGILLDTGGDDRYANADPAMGIPIVNLDVLPGGDAGSFDERRNNRVWIDGPGTINVGLGIDQEAVLATGQSDSDGWADVIEFLVGTDPEDPESHPQSSPLVRAAALVDDADGDGYPGYIERAFSTDPADPRSYPAGFPAGIAVRVPAETSSLLPDTIERTLGIEDGTITPFRNATGSNFTSSDKIVDLRLPLQDAGTIDYACTGQFYPNATAPMGIGPGGNLFTRLGFGPVAAPLFPNPVWRNVAEDRGNGGPATQENGDPYQTCLFVSYDTTSPGEGNATTPRPETSALTATQTRGEQFSFHLPAGILAIGDVVDTKYVDDYFVVIDLGGADRFHNSAGGALIVRTRPILAPGQNANDAGPQRVTNTFLAPSLVVNVDVRDVPQTLVVEPSDDTYANASRDFVHGAYYGVLVDTAGNDTYVARDGSQGAIGGVLLDLSGTDTYVAGNLSQGASLASTSARSEGDNGRPIQDLPQGGNVPTDEVGATRSGSFTGSFGLHRRVVPGILLDVGAGSGTGTQTYLAGAHSQGFARGFNDQWFEANSTRVVRNSPVAYGILASLGNVSTELLDARGRHSQGVGGVGGAGILLNAGGDHDDYRAASLISQGATIPQALYTGEAQPNNVPQPALGVLVDLAGFDAYTASDPVLRTGGARAERQNALTIQRSTTSSDAPGLSGNSVYADLGVHLDADAQNNPAGALGALLGTGGIAPVDPSAASGYLVYMPTARLAIGSNASTTYTKEFAFVVDLGGNNTYRHNAGGFVRDVLASAPAGVFGLDSSTTYGLNPGLFPVTLVVDAGRSDSLYESSSSFTQGSGFFGVGIVADLGGNDTLVAKPSVGPSMGSQHLSRPPIIDANIGSDWDGIMPTTMTTMRSMDDSRFSPQGWEIRVANDNSALYVAIKGRTSSADEAQRLLDTLNVTLDMGRRQTPWNASAGRTGADQVRFEYVNGKCRVTDWGMGTTNAYVQDGSDAGLVGACRSTPEGEVFYEFMKPLVEQAPADPGDLGYCVDPITGLFGHVPRLGERGCVAPGSELGLYVEFGDAGAAFADPPPNQNRTAYFSWPGGAADQDGEAGHARSGTIADEMRTWMAVGLAQNGQAGVAPRNVVPATLSQGVGLSGVGIVAMLGTVYGETRYTSGDMSQAYGTFGGLGILLDSVGADTYTAGKRSLAAGEARGYGLLLDLEGNDNYRPVGDALGWVPGVDPNSGAASFFDLSGDDHYAFRPSGTRWEQLRKLPGDDPGTQLPPDGNNVAWQQGLTGVGLDFRATELVRQRVLATTLDLLYGDDGEARTTFDITAYDANDNRSGPWGNGCTTQSILPASAAKYAAYRAKGKVCFIATVNTGNSTAYSNTRGLGNLLGDPAKALLTGATQNTTVGGRLDVAAVDFMVDRARVATSYARTNVNATYSRWSAPVDLAEIPDGVVRAKALPLFAAHLDQGFGTFLFYDDIADYYNDETATKAVRTLLIDNPSRPSVRLNCSPDGSPDVCAPPSFTGAWSAAFSAYGVAQAQKLFVNYTVDHDVGEDRYAQANDWRPRRENSSYPCRGVPAPDSSPQLCNTLPFYLGGDKLTTLPARDPVATQIVTEVEGRASYSAATHDLESDLRILDNESFRLAIPTRDWLDPLNAQITEVKLKIYNGNLEVKTSARTPGCDPSHTTCTWFAGYIQDRAPQVDGVNDTAERSGQRCVSQVEQTCTVQVPGGGAVTTIYGAVQRQINNQTTAVNNISKGLSNPLRLVTDTTYSQVCSSYDAYQCRTLRGKALTGSGQLAMCEGTNFNPVLRQAVASLDSTARATTGRDVVCHNYYQNDINKTADTYGPPIGNVTGGLASDVTNLTGVANDAVATNLNRNLTGPGRVDGINFTDIRFDVTDPRAVPPTVAHCNENGCIRMEGGNLVIPKGFRIGLEFGITKEAPCPQNACALVGDGIRLGRENAYDGVNTTATFTDPSTCDQPTGCVTAYNPAPRLLGPNYHTFGQVNQTLREHESGRPLQAILGGAALPAAFFLTGGGPIDQQPRLEIRTPAEPSTRVSVSIEDALTGDVAATLRSGTLVVGDLPGTPTREISTPHRANHSENRTNATYWALAGEWPHVNWTANASFPRWTQQSIVYDSADLPDGLYHVTVRATDANGEVAKREPVLIDHTAPATFVSTDPYAGKSTLVGTQIPIRWSVFEQGSGLKEVWLFTRDGPSGAWKNEGVFSPDVRTYLKSKSAGVNEYFFITVGVDRANNTEMAPSTPETPYRTIAEAARAGFQAKLALGDAGWRRVVIDEVNPRYRSIEVAGGRVQNYLGDDFTFVRAGAPVRFEICAIDGTVDDAGSGIQLVNLSLDRFDPLARSLINATFTMRREGPCATGGTLFVHDTWGSVNTDATRFPEGVWVAQFEIFDNANNRIRVRPEGAAGNIVLDHRSPEVHLEDPVLPTGQSAVKPGDVVKIRIVARDDFGLDEDGIRVDASKFARNASALKTKSVRVNGIIYQEAQFTVDLPSIQNGVYPILVKVPDLAGGVTTVQTAIAVNFKPFEFVPGSLRVTNVTHNAVTLKWQTDEPTSGLAKFGTTSVALTGRTPQDLNLTADHTLVVTGLKPNTHYFLRAVAVSAGGFTKESETIEVDTLSALFLAPISPVSGDKVSGNVAVKFRGGLLDSGDFVTYTLEVRDSANESKPWTFLTTATRQGDVHTLGWNSTRYLDGTTYQLRLSAVAGTGAAADRTSLVIGPLTSDNTPPSVLVLSPLLATNDTTPQLVAEASDGLAGLASGPIRLLVDGEPVPGKVSVEQLPAARVRVTYNFTQPLAAGLRTFELQVPDRAGNVAKEIWKVAIDGQAPAIKIEPSRFAPGTAAAKRGGTVTLNITTCDVSGAASALADVGELRAATPELRLTRILSSTASKDCYLIPAIPAAKNGWTFVNAIGGAFAIPSGAPFAAPVAEILAIRSDGPLAEPAVKGVYGEWHGTLTVSASDASGVKQVPVRLVDLAGNERTIVIDVPIDNVAPEIASRSLAEVKHRRVAIDVPANEPILLNGTATAPASPPVSVATTEARTNARLVFDGLLPSRTYQYRISATDRAGNAVDLTGEFATLRDTLPPSAVGPLSVLDLLNGTLRLTWAPATDDVLVSHYRVYRSDDGITFRPIADAPAAQYDDGGLPYEKSYVYKVAAVDFGANEGEASPALRAAATAVPHLTVGVVTPTVGTTSTTFRYTVTYTSPGGVPPAYVRIILDGVPQNMTLESGTAKTGAVYVYETRLAPHKRDAPHTYAFEASDGRYTVRFPDGADVLRGPLVSGDGLGSDDAGGFAAFAQRVPLGGVGAVAIALAVALGLAAALRRKKEGSK